MKLWKMQKFTTKHQQLMDGIKAAELTENDDLVLTLLVHRPELIEFEIVKVYYENFVNCDYYHTLYDEELRLEGNPEVYIIDWFIQEEDLCGN